MSKKAKGRKTSVGRRKRTRKRDEKSFANTAKRWLREEGKRTKGDRNRLGPRGCVMEIAEAFLADIIDNPDDDTPRLIFADWLDEHGNEARGEFIRVQCALAGYEKFTEQCECQRLLERDRPCDWCRLKKRERELMGVTSVCALWLDLVPCGVSEPFPQRGFLRSVTCTAANWVIHSDAILAIQPVVEVKLTDFREPFRRDKGETAKAFADRIIAALQEWAFLTLDTDIYEALGHLAHRRSLEVFPRP